MHAYRTEGGVVLRCGVRDCEGGMFRGYTKSTGRGNKFPASERATSESPLGQAPKPAGGPFAGARLHCVPSDWLIDTNFVLQRPRLDLPILTLGSIAVWTLPKYALARRVSLVRWHFHQFLIAFDTKMSPESFPSDSSMAKRHAFSLFSPHLFSWHTKVKAMKSLPEANLTV
jgi:hypothetical protein